MGLPVKPTGTLDPQTVGFINAVLGSWDDAPPKLRTGSLSAREIKSQLGLVAKLIKRAASGATSFERLPG